MGTTTHKTLRGPRSGIIFCKRSYINQINSAVFPMLQGGPHNHQIGGVAVALKEAATEDFQNYARAVIQNAQALARGLQANGYVLATGGTDNHLLLWDVRPLGLTGSKLEKVLELASITTNKNSLPGDLSAINPGGVRLGTPALTTRGMSEADFDQVAEFLYQGCNIAIEAQSLASRRLQAQLDAGEIKRKTNKVLLKDFKQVLASDEVIISKIDLLRQSVEDFATPFYMPGC